MTIYNDNGGEVNEITSVYLGSNQIYAKQNLLGMKLRPKDEKIEFLRYQLTNRNTTDAAVVENISALLTPGKQFPDIYFSHPSVLFNSFVEFQDIKLALRDELKTLKEDLLGMFISCIKNVGEINEAENPQKMPTFEASLLSATDFMIMSKIWKKITPTEKYVNTIYSNSMTIVAMVSRHFQEFFEVLPSLVTEQEMEELQK